MFEPPNSPARPERRLHQRRQESNLTEARLENSQRIACLGDWEYNFQSSRLHWSKEIYRILGLARTAAPPDSESFYRLVHPEDLAFVHREKLAAAEGRKRADFHHRIIRPDGEVRHIHQIVELAYDAEGRPVRELGTLQDITERWLAENAMRESNVNFHQLADNITDAFWIRSPDLSEVHYVSPAFERIWGRPVADLLANPQQWSEFILAEDRARVVVAFAALSAEAPTLDIEYRIVRPNGEIRWVHVRGIQLRNERNQVMRHIGIVTDITTRKLVDEHMLQAQKMEALGQFSGGMAHDFNNILAAISGYTELARMQLAGDSKVLEHLDAVMQSTNRAADLVRQILTFSRQQPQVRQVMLLQPVVVESMKLMRATIPVTIEINASVSADAPTVLANANQVHQVLMNLAINAWHALNNQPGQLLVTLEKVEVDAAYAAAKPGLRPGTYARLSVSDTGCGMDAPTLRRIFEPFFTTKPPGEGTGLGLSVVHGIMDSHDGAVTVHSQPGEGTKFCLYFPAQAGEAVIARGVTAKAPHGQGERVLVVDDEELIANLARNVLTRMGYSVECTTSSAQALELVRTDPARFALVITDQTMPGMTGLQLAVQLREIRADLPVMLMTGYNLSYSTVRVGESGISNVLLKPFTMEALAVAVHATLAGKPYHSNGTYTPY